MSHFEIHSYPLLIREQHLDSFGHVNNAIYLELFEEARWEFVTARGFGLDVIHSKGMGPVVLEFNLKFLKELRLREQISIQSQLLSYDKKIATMRQEMFNEKGESCCQAKMTFGLMCFKTRKLILPTPEWLQAIGFVCDV